MSRFKQGLYYTVGGLWLFLALAVLISLPFAAIVGLIVIVRAALTGAGLI